MALLDCGPVALFLGHIDRDFGVYVVGVTLELRIWRTVREVAFTQLPACLPAF